MPPSWVPRPSAAKRVLGLDLSAREGHVLSRIDGAIDIDQLCQVIGCWRTPAPVPPTLG